MSKRPKKKNSCGGCKINTAHPAYPSSTKIYNFSFTFEEALKLHLAIESAVHRLNQYNRATAAGRDALMYISAKEDYVSVQVD